MLDVAGPRAKELLVSARRLTYASVPGISGLGLILGADLLREPLAGCLTRDAE